MAENNPTGTDEPDIFDHSEIQGKMSVLNVNRVNANGSRLTAHKECSEKREPGHI